MNKILHDHFILDAINLLANSIILIALRADFITATCSKCFKNHFANSDSMRLNALNSIALPNGSRKNIVACSPGSPLKRI